MGEKAAVSNPSSELNWLVLDSSHSSSHSSDYRMWLRAFNLHSLPSDSLFLNKLFVPTLQEKTGITMMLMCHFSLRSLSLHQAFKDNYLDEAATSAAQAIQYWGSLLTCETPCRMRLAQGTGCYYRKLSLLRPSKIVIFSRGQETWWVKE